MIAVMNHDLFESPKALLNWAYEDTEQFKELERAFFGSEPYEGFVDFDAERQRDIHRVRMVDSPPAEMRKLASHVINDLRHSLDQATFAAASFFGWLPSRTQKVIYFPWSSGPTDLKGQLGRIPEEIHQIFSEVEPYDTREKPSRGNDVIRQLGTLGGPNKHEVALSSQVIASLTNMTVPEGGPQWLVPYPEKMWDSEKEHLTLIEFPTGTVSDYNADISFRIRFKDRPLLQEYAASDLLTYWGTYAQHVVQRLERRVLESAG